MTCCELFVLDGNRFQLEVNMDQQTCQSNNHVVPDECRGELWQCTRCMRWFCYSEGADDDYLSLCDDCAVEEMQSSQE